ncbi:MAG: hypothetical protein BWY14_01261 [Parcubacteria group bacterium ADurb.Bin192]|jgi:hypothetical protein|nr:MAG: hypothetical protein BWY14_01261 [Parcubacteria group bacterium ADurb.Bin192]
MVKMADTGDLMCRVYGPYKGRDGRYRCIIYKDGARKTVSYPRMILEKHIGRELESTEDVHHKDGNVENNDVDNLEVVPHSSHCRSHATIYFGRKTSCVYCGKTIALSARQESSRAREAMRGKAGPFCSKICSGKYGKHIQLEHLSRNI